MNEKAINKGKGKSAKNPNQIRKQGAKGPPGPRGYLGMKRVVMPLEKKNSSKGNKNSRPTIAGKLSDGKQRKCVTEQNKFLPKEKKEIGPK